ncbi:MAG: hypothetical protein IJW40_01020 [Clostridia bacterium]|nr:hypothetical protein [Clostridia bacterium]
MQHKVVTLCGSFRFWEEMQKAAETLSLEHGWVVLPPLPHVLDRSLTDGEKQQLGALHLARIDLADAIYVVNVDGYIGEAVKREIAYATAKGKEILYLFAPK